MNKILVTGFEPFNGRDVNPAGKLVNDVSAPGSAELKRLTLPVEFVRSDELLRRAAEEYRPDAILSLGQAGNRPSLAVERVAVNLDCCRYADGSGILPDEYGDAPADRAIVPGGPDAYIANAPVWDIVSAINGAGIKAVASYSAGTFVCNHIMYTGCDIAAKAHIISCFIHVPFLPEQMNENASGRYAMEYDLMLKGVNAALETIVKCLS